MLIMTNMLHFGSARREQREAHLHAIADPSAGPSPTEEIDVIAAQAALSSLPMNLTSESTLVSRVDVSDDEKLQSLHEQERLIDEEREVSEKVPMSMPMSVSKSVSMSAHDQGWGARGPPLARLHHVTG